MTELLYFKLDRHRVYFLTNSDGLIDNEYLNDILDDAIKNVKAVVTMRPPFYYAKKVNNNGNGDRIDTYADLFGLEITIRNEYGSFNSVLLSNELTLLKSIKLKMRSNLEGEPREHLFLKNIGHLIR